MAENDFVVTISSPALSLLFYENVRNRGDQMGFLLGETLEYVVKTYTDMENQVETVKRYNNIQAVVTCPLPEYLHDSIGRINKETLKELLHDKSKQVIGWFRFRENMNLIPTFRDKNLHKEFASYFSNVNGSKKEFFVACLLNSSVSNKGGTHKFKHVFLRQKNMTFEPIPVRINNLGSDSFVCEGSDYKPTPTKKSTVAPDMFSKLIESWHLDLTKTSEIKSAWMIQKSAERYFSNLIPRLCESDLEVAELEKQIKELKLKKMLRINDNSNNLSKKYVIKEVKVNEDKILPSLKSLDSTHSHYTPSQELSTLTCHKRTVQLPKDIQYPTMHFEKNVNIDKLRRKDTDTINSPSQGPPFKNSVSEMKIDITESVSNKNKRPTITESEIVKESICKGEEHGVGVGRGARKLIHNTNSDIRKGRSLAPTQSSSQRTKY